MGNFFSSNKISGITNFTEEPIEVLLESALDPITGSAGGYPHAVEYAGFMYFIGANSGIYRYPVQYPGRRELVICTDCSGGEQAPINAENIGTFASLISISIHHPDNGLYLLSALEEGNNSEIFISRLSFSAPALSQFAGAFPDLFVSVSGPTVGSGIIGNLTTDTLSLYFSVVATNSSQQDLHHGTIAEIFDQGTTQLSSFPNAWPGELIWSIFLHGTGTFSLVLEEDVSGTAFYGVYFNGVTPGSPPASPAKQASLRDYGTITQLVQQGSNLYFLSTVTPNQPPASNLGIYLYGFEDSDPETDASLKIGPNWLNTQVQAAGFSISASPLALLLSREDEPQITYRMNPSLRRKFSVPPMSGNTPGLTSFDAMVSVPFGLTSAGGFLKVTFFDSAGENLPSSYLFHTTDPLLGGVGFWTALATEGPFTLLDINENPVGGSSSAQGMLIGARRQEGGGILIIGEMDIDPLQ